MKWISLLLLLIASPAFGGDWTLTFHMPSSDMGASCGSIGQAHPVGHTGRAIIRWSGPSAGADSLSNLPDGALASFSRLSVPDGTYTFSAWVWDVGGYSCPVVVQKVVLTPDAPPVAPNDILITP